MLKRPFKKLIGLVLFYTVCITGIFVIQFKSDSIIRKSIRNLRLVVAETESQNDAHTLKNSFQVSYNGIIFSGDSQNPVTYSKNGRSVPVSLVSYRQSDMLSWTLVFTDDVSLTFSLSEDSDTASLWINATMAEGADSVSVNFSPYGGYSLGEVKAKSAVFRGRENEYSLAAPALLGNRLSLQNLSKTAHYSVITKQSEFNLDLVDGLALAEAGVYGQTLSALGQTVISEFLRAAAGEVNFESSVQEQTVISFMAAMAEAGRYNEGLDAVPEAFSKGNRRTFLSAPFFGGMAALLPSLTMHVENLNNMILRAVQERSLEIWTVSSIGPFLYTQGNRGNIALLAAIPASMPDLNPTVAQAAGILRAHAYLASQNSSIATPLEPVLETCAQKIINSCQLDGEKIMLSENDAPLSVLAAVTAGDALVSYGSAFNNEAVKKTGFLIINSYAGDTAGLGLKTCAELYPVILHENTFYPRYLLLKTAEPANVWAWTSAANVTYTRDENLTISLDVDFPVGLSHYLFVQGIQPFRRIQIYNMDFRSDPRFEIYNSSGYVYRSASQSLLLKSRHRESRETVRLYYRDIVEEEAESEAPGAEEEAY